MLTIAKIRLLSLCHVQKSVMFLLLFFKIIIGLTEANRWNQLLESHFAVFSLCSFRVALYPPIVTMYPPIGP